MNTETEYMERARILGEKKGRTSFGLAVHDEFDQGWCDGYYARAAEILLAVIGGAS
jgi:hypothetical protein